MRADNQTDQNKKMKSFSEKLFNFSLGGKTRFSRNSKSSSCSWRTHKVLLPKVSIFYLKITDFCSLQTALLLDIPKNPDFVPKTCIIYFKMDQTVSIQQKHSRTAKNNHHRFKSYRLKARISKQNRPFDQKFEDNEEYTYCFRFQRMNSKNKECSWSLKTKRTSFLERE